MPGDDFVAPDRPVRDGVIEALMAAYQQSDPEAATALPCAAAPVAPLPTSLLPCCDHTPPVRVNTHTAPTWVLSPLAPSNSVLPFPASATALP